ncbi:DEAD/DEAH box helicase [Lewinella sp. LCG006]|uniref:DEAD/DEAH box helicase n=1 Tax=Lewinella sp. LCG006 TaxID=3231911 RepID=UPI0034615D48
MTFNSLGIIDPILRALEVKGYTKPTPIQEQSIPILLKGKDLLGCAQTGTGKTAAFAIPIIQQLCEANLDGPYVIKALVVAPTRELAIQINDSFQDYAKFTDLRSTVIFGGVKQGKQVDILKKGVDILVATPGRLLDLMNQGFISLRDVEYVVLDEADHMLDMGFIHDIKKIVAKLPEKRQSLFFSATMPPAIMELSSKILGNPEKVTIKPQQATAEKVGQALYYVDKKQKRKLLHHLIVEEKMESVLVFSRTKHGANRIVKDLNSDGIGAAAIHGNKSQTARQKALQEFRDGDLQVLVATDIAARGIDVDELAFVINFDLPNVPETYVHRIGRTGRAQASGIAISFCDQEERAYLRDIQRLIKQDVPVVEDHPYPDDGTRVVTENSSSSQQQRSRSNGGNNNRRRGPGNSSSSGSRSGGGNRRRFSSSR